MLEVFDAARHAQLMGSLSLIVERKPSDMGLESMKVEGVCNICRSFVGMAVCGRERGGCS